MGFELRKKGKFKEANKFVERMQEIQGEAKAALSKAQEDMKKYVDRYRGEVEEYKVGDLVLLSTKDLKYQMVGRRMEKLTERFIGPYKVKSIVSTNAIELELPSTVKIHLVVNVSRVRRYTSQVEGQKKEAPQPVVIKGKEEWEVEKIMNKRQVRERDKYLVRWKRCTAEEDTWESRENLKNASDLVEEFEKEYRREEEEETRRQEKEEEKNTFSRGLPGKYTAKLLYEWGKKKYEQEYWKKLEENWRQWKRNPFAKVSHNPFLWIKQKEEDEMGNIGDWDSEL